MERHLIPFHDHSILLIEDDQGDPWIPMKPIVERLGLDWRSQRRKLMEAENAWRWGFITLPSGGGPQETLCLAVSHLHAWLFSIAPSRVRPDLRPAVIRYRNECADVLWRYWSGQRQALADRLAERDRQVTDLREMLLSEKPFWSKVERYRRRGWPARTIAVLTRRSAFDVQEVIDTLERIGVLETPPAVASKSAPEVTHA